MINEFFKSIFRTLGRICAYVLLGALVYFFFAWFSHVDAQTINVSNYHIEGLDKNNSIVQNCFNCNTMLTDDGLRILGWEYYPMDNNWNYIGINSGSYTLDYSWTMSTAFIDTDDKLTHNLPRVKTLVKSGNNMISATCDGTEAVSHVDRTVIDNIYYHTYRYQCSRLDVTQNFSQVGINVYWEQYKNYVLMANWIRNFVIQFSSFIDQNELSADADAIMNNNNINTQRIINAISDFEGDLQSVNAELIDVNSGINDTYDYLSDDTQPNSNGFFSTIINMAPSDTPISGLVALPLNILNKEVHQISEGVCRPWTINFGSFFNNYVLTIPCIDPSIYLTGYAYAGYTLWELIDFMICLFLGYEIAMLMVNSYSRLFNLEDTFVGLYTSKDFERRYKLY